MKKKIRLCILILLVFLFIASLSRKQEKSLVAGKADENGLFQAGDYTFMKMEPYKEYYIQMMADKMNQIKELYFPKSNRVFFAIIPDKGYFVKNEYYSKEDYKKMSELLTKELKGITMISLFDSLEISDYYKTDHHWRQERLEKVVKVLGKAMNFTIDLNRFQINTLNSFQGVYAKHLSQIPEETLCYLTNEVTKRAEVFPYGGKKTTVYDKSKLSSASAYDFFLSGPNPLITVVNTQAKSERELVIFGDSFSLSLIPLLLPAYGKITMIDLRFAPTDKLSDYVEFQDQDVLMIYNTAVINRSIMLN